MRDGRRAGGVGWTGRTDRASWLCAALIALSTWLIVSEPRSEQQPAWSTSFPEVGRQVAAGRPFVVAVVVPLCDNDQIHCGSEALGRPGDLGTNLYWGAMYGARRHFDDPRNGFDRVDRSAGDSDTLEQAVYRRSITPARWGSSSRREQIVVLMAMHGATIDRAVDRFWELATRGGRVQFQDAGQQRDERVHVVGYAGHNRLMDGKRLRPLPAGARAPVPSFVLACLSERYFGDALRAAGSTPLITTRSLIAPEGYAIAAVVRALGDNQATADVRAQLVRDYAKWQRIPVATSARYF